MTNTFSEKLISQFLCGKKITNYQCLFVYTTRDIYVAYDLEYLCLVNFVRDIALLKENFRVKQKMYLLFHLHKQLYVL